MCLLSCRLGKILEIEEVVEALMEGIVTNKKMVFVPSNQGVGLLLERWVGQKNVSSVTCWVYHPQTCKIWFTIRFYCRTYHKIFYNAVLLSSDNRRRHPEIFLSPLTGSCPEPLASADRCQCRIPLLYRPPHSLKQPPQPSPRMRWGPECLFLYVNTKD